MQLSNLNPRRGMSRYSSLSGRIAHLLNILGDGKPHKAAELAQIIGVNSRTIRRTLHMMRDEIGIPLEISREGFNLKQTNENTSQGSQAVSASSTKCAPLPATSRFLPNHVPQRN